MQHVILTFLILVFSISLHGQMEFDLEDAINYAKEFSNSKKKAQLDVMDSEQLVKEYKSIGMPKLSLDAGYTYFPLIPANPVDDFISPAIYGVLFQEQVIPQRELGPPETFKLAFQRKQSLNAGLNFSALLFDQAYLKGLKASKLSIDISRAQILLTDKEVASMVTKSYLAVLIAERNIEFLDKNIEVLKKSLGDTKTIYESGFAEQLDIDRLSLSADNLSIEKENVEELITLSYNVLKYNMSYPLEEELILTESLEDLLNLINVDEKLLTEEIDFTNRPEFSLLNQAIELDQMDVNRLGQNLPTLRLNAGLDGTLQRDRLLNNDETGIIPSAFVALGLNYNIFDGRERRSQKQRSIIRMEKKKIDLEEFQRGMTLEVVNAKSQLQNAKRTLENRERTLALSESIFEKANIKFREGVGSSVEVSQAESSLYDSQSKLINAMYDLVLAKANLDIAFGNIK